MEGYRDLCRVTDAAYQAELARMRQLTRDEQSLRATLADLDRQLAESLNPARQTDSDWRAIGADQAWRQWLSRRKAEANMQLARILSRKADAARRLKVSFARKQVSEEILDLQIEQARLDRQRQI